MKDVVIVGAGPYGLSLAAYLAKTKLSFRVFGTPMHSWANQMPHGMHLKSDGFASTLYAPGDPYTLEDYYREKGIPYTPIGDPVPREIFVGYGREFQRRLVPTLEPVDITRVEQIPGGFGLTTATGEVLQAKQVVVAAGITHFGYIPPTLAGLPPELLSHSLGINELGGFAGKKIAVIGAGSSAVDVATLIHEAGAEVHLVGRRKALLFHEAPQEPRPLLDRIKNPRSGLGLGWKSRLCCDIPLVFHKLPLKLRMRAVERHLGPAPGWFMRDRVVGKFPLHLSTQIKSAVVKDGKAVLTLTEADGSETVLTMDYVVAATGFKPYIERLKFLSDGIREKIETIENNVVLKNNFESSIPGLYFIGLAASNSFGPMLRFAVGAGFTAKHLSRRLAA